MSAFSASEEAEILLFNPFDGDFGGAGSRDCVLSDRMVTVRLLHQCHWCLGPIAPGERVRARAEIFDDAMMQFRWCAACCRAAIKDDSGIAYEERLHLYRRKPSRRKSA